MGSVLLIKNNYSVDEELLEQLREKYKIHLANDAWDGLNVIDENNIDVFVIFSGNHTEPSTKDFIKGLHQEGFDVVPIIFISEKQSEELLADMNKMGYWYFISYPVDYKDFKTVLKRAMNIAEAFDKKSIMLKKQRHLYTYKVRDISRIQRSSKNRHIIVYSRDPITGIEKKEEFFFEYPLHYFIKRHGLEKYIKQAQKGWLVHASEVVKIKTDDMELVLRCGTVIPTSKKYIDNFKK